MLTGVIVSAKKRRFRVWIFILLIGINKKNPDGTVRVLYILNTAVTRQQRLLLLHHQYVFVVIIMTAKLNSFDSKKQMMSIFLKNS